MQLALSALQLQPGRVGGVEVYFRNLVSSLAELDQENEYIILANGEAFDSLELPYPNFRKILVELPAHLWPLLPRRIIRKAKQIVLGRHHPTGFVDDLLAEKVNRLGIHFIHHPFSVVYPLSLSSRNILTFWDMQQEFFPEFFPDDIIVWRSRHYPTSVELAEHIIVGSHFTKKNLVEKYNVPPEKISIIYFGTSPEFQRTILPEQIAELRLKYSLNDKFIFYPAATFPHKNHIRLVQAFKLLGDRVKDVQLVLTGAEMMNEARLAAEIDELNLRQRVKRLGYVPAHELPVFYAAASMLVFPSLFEGYGIPLIEAMQVGCPLVSSNMCSLPELAGDAAVFIDPMDIEDMVQAMFNVLTNRDLAVELTARGHHQVAGFSWLEAASKTIKVYEAVYHSTKNVKKKVNTPGSTDNNP